MARVPGVSAGRFDKPAQTASTTAASSGNAPVWSFEKINSPSTATSKHPPPPGTNFNSSIRCLNPNKSRAVKLTAFGS